MNIDYEIKRKITTQKLGFDVLYESVQTETFKFIDVIDYKVQVLSKFEELKSPYLNWEIEEDETEFQVDERGILYVGPWFRVYKTSETEKITVDIEIERYMNR